MRYFSTRDSQKSKPESLKQAVLDGLAKDGGLYIPEHIYPLPPSFFEALPSMSFDDINIEVVSHLIADDFSSADLKNLVVEAMNFSIPINHLHDDVFVQELFHGPTMAFKDVGARFMARLMAAFTKDFSSELNVIVATSGDTGGAVAAGFFEVPGIKVYILYPKGKVSPLQEKQLTTWGKNIQAIEVDGNFDDCQRLAKLTLADLSLRPDYIFTSANSINIARLIPQTLYYFHAFRLLQHTGKPLVVSVPSGNFGNLTGGLIAKKMGLPIEKFIAATNANDTVPVYLKTGEYAPKPSVATISNAMDVGNPSNFERMLALVNGLQSEMSALITAFVYSDEETRQVMREVFTRNGYMLDPHGAVAYLGLKDFLAKSPGRYTGVFLETAHPVKFIEVVEETLNVKLELPVKMQEFVQKEKMAYACANDYKALRAILIG